VKITSLRYIQTCNSETGFMRIEGKKFTSSVPIVYSLNANTLRITDGLAGVVFAR
jgi:hypothetical protein